MPVMNGINAVKRIMAESPTPIIMLSAFTHEGAKPPWMLWMLGARFSQTTEWFQLIRFD